MSVLKEGIYRGINAKLYGAKVSVSLENGELIATFENGQTYKVDGPWMQAFVEPPVTPKPACGCGMGPHSAAARKMVEVVWCSLKRDPGHDNRRETAWGTKTECGLAACFDRIINETV